MPQIRYDFEDKGGKAIEKRFGGITKSAIKTEQAFKALAKDLGVNETELKRIAKSLGLNQVQLRKVIASMGDWQAEGVKLSRQFAALKKSIEGIEPAQFRELAAIAQKTSEASKQATAETKKLAKATEDVGKATQGIDLGKLAAAQSQRGASGRTTSTQSGVIASNPQQGDLNLQSEQQQLKQVLAQQILQLKQQVAQTEQTITLAKERLSQSRALAQQEKEQASKASELTQARGDLARSLGISAEEVVKLSDGFDGTAKDLTRAGAVLRSMVQSGTVTKTALTDLANETGLSVRAIAGLAKATSVRAKAQESAVQEQRRSQQAQKQLATTSAQLAKLLGITDVEARKLATAFDITSKEVGELRSLKSLAQQGQLTEQGIEQFAASSRLASDQFIQLAQTIQRRTQAEVEAANATKDGRAQQRESRSQQREGSATSRVAAQLDLSFDGAAQLSQDLKLASVETEKAIALMKRLDAAGQSSDQQIQALSKTFGLNAQQARQLAAAYEDGKSSVENFGQNIASAAQDLGLTFGQARKLQGQIGLTSEQFEKAAQTLNQMRSAGASAEESFEALQKEVGITSKQFQQLDKVGRSAQAGLQELAAGAAGLSLAIGAPLTKGVQTFIDFERQIKQTGVLTGSFNTEKGQQEFKALSDEVQRLGATTPKSASEIAEFTTTMARAGFSAEQIENGLQGVTNASIATGNTMEQVGDVVGVAINQFGLAAKDSERIADILVTTANSSPQGVEDIGEALKFVGSTAKTSGQTLESTTKILARLAAAGIKGSSAGTQYAEALRRVDLASAATTTKMGKLFEGNKKATQAFERLQLSATNADGTMKQFPEVLDAIQESTAGLSRGDKAVLINSLFGVRGGNAIKALLGLTEEKVKEIDDNFDNLAGSASRAGEQMKQGLSGSIDALNSALEGAFLQLGSALEPIVTPLVNGLTAVLSGFAQLPAPIQTVIATVGGFTAIVAAAIGVVAGLQAANAALGVSQGVVAAKILLTTTATKAATVATTAYAIAQKVLTADVGSGVKVLASMAKQALALIPGLGGATAASGGLSAGLGATAVAAKGALLAALPLVATLGALVAAVLLTKNAFDVLQAGVGNTGQALQNKEALESFEDGLKEIRGEAEKTKSALDLLAEGDIFGALGQGLADIQQSFAEFLGLTDEASEQVQKYGQSFGVVSQEQLENQQAQLKWQEILEKANPILEDGVGLLSKYGVVGKKTAEDLSPEQFAQFQKEAGQTIKEIELAISELEKVDTDEARKEIENLQAVLKRLQGGAGEATESTANSLDDMAKRSGKSIEELQGQLDELISGGLSEQDALAQLSATLEVDADTDPAEEALKGLQKEFDDRFAKQKIDIEANVQQGKENRKFVEEERRESEQEAFEDAQRSKTQAFEDDIAAQKRQIEADIAADKQRFEDKLQSDRQAFEKQQEAAKLNFEAEQRQAEQAFNDAQEVQKRVFDEEQASKKLARDKQDEARKRAFEAEIEARKAAFAKQQQAEERAFQAALELEDKAKQEGFSEEEKQLERQLQLETAESPEEQARLEEQFAKEDEVAKRREELFAGLNERRNAWEEERQAKEEAFKAKQEEERIAEEERLDEERRAKEEALAEDRRAFEQELRDEALAFEQEIESQKRTFEEEQAEAKKTFEDDLAIKKEQLEEKLEVRKRAFEDELEQRKLQSEQAITDQKREFENQLRDEKRRFEDEQELKQKAFEDNERKLEAQHKKDMLDLEKTAQETRDRLTKENAEQVKRILESTDISNLGETLDRAAALEGTLRSSAGSARNAQSQVRGLFRGGAVTAGETAWVGEFGPELVTFPRNGRVLSRRDSIKAVQQSIHMQLPAIAANIVAPTATVPHSGFTGSDVRRMQKTLDSIDRKLSNRGGPTKVSAPSFTFNRWDNPDDEMFRALKAYSRAGY